MANPESQAYSSGGVAAGWIETDQVAVAADTYYVGMLMKYSADGTVVEGGTNTGNGTVTAVTATRNVAPGEYTLTLTGALTAQLTGPGGAILVNEIDLADGDAVTVNYLGLEFTITDGGTAFVANDDFAITVPSTGTYEATTGFPDAIYNGVDEKVYSSAGYANVIVGGQVLEEKLVDSSGDALTVTNSMIAGAQLNGIWIKRQ